jgi:hypothetical protein
MDQTDRSMVPSARVVRQAGAAIPPPRTSLGSRARGLALSVAVGGRAPRS